MHTPDIFEQIAQGMSDPKKISQWLNQSWPAAVDGGAATAQTRAWIGSLESLLQGAEALRQLQLDAIHKTQRRTSQLARSLRDARSPADTVAALQSFAQANMEDAQQYWSAYGEIAQDAEQHMLDKAAALAAGKGTFAPAGPAPAAGRPKRPAASRGKTPRAD